MRRCRSGCEAWREGTADTVRLEEWGLRVPDAGSLDDVLAQPPRVTQPPSPATNPPLPAVAGSQRHPMGSKKAMTIKVGDTIPSMKLMVATPEGPKETSTDDIFKGKKVVLFAVPGAFTPTCSAKHLPGFVQNADAIKAKGVDAIACISVNDAFVMGAWGKDQGTGCLLYTSRCV